MEEDHPIRRDLVQRLKAQVYLEQYDITDQMFDLAVERLIDDVLADA